MTAALAVPTLLMAQADDAALTARARAIHRRVLTLDSHIDTEPALLTQTCNYTQRLITQVNLPKMRAGGLDAGFFIVHVPQGPVSADAYPAAHAQALARFDALHRQIEHLAPNRMGLALTPAQVDRIARTGRTVAIIGVENGYPLGTDVSRVRDFYARGGRYMSLTHNGHNQLADSHTGEATHDAPNGGLSALGRAVVTEMNRLGMMVDVSHISKAAMLQSVAFSQAPVIASHSAARALANHSRNLDDEQLLAIGRSGGVVQVVAYAGFLKVGTNSGRPPLREILAALPPGSCPLEAAGTPPLSVPARPGVTDLVDHIDYIARRIGIDHVGISSDFEGGGGIEGWDSAADTFSVTLELVRRGYSEPDIARLWGGNLLRVWREADRTATRLRAD